MTRNTIIRNGKTTTETQYFISSLAVDAKEIARAIRGHWAGRSAKPAPLLAYATEMMESYHWHLDVTFREDANRTLNKHVAYNLNILRKLALNVLKLLDVGRKRVSLAKKRFMICCNPYKYINQILEI